MNLVDSSFTRLHRRAQAEAVAGAANGMGTPSASAPMPWRGKRVALLVNQGCRRGQACGQIADELVAAFEALGALPTAACGDMQSQVQSITDARPDVVVSLGGDGTIRTAARLAIEANANLLIVPLGTMNLVAKDLKLPLDSGELIAGLASVVEQSADYATVNGELFLHSSLLGVIPQLTVLRERLREHKPPSSRLRDLRDFVIRPFTVPHLRLNLTTDRGRVVRRTRSLAITVNPLADARLGQHRRESVCGGRFGVYASVHHGPLAPLRMLASLATARVLRDPDFHTGICESITIHSRHRWLDVANDGEVKRLSTPLRYEMHGCALRVLVPAPDAQADRPTIAATP